MDFRKSEPLFLVILGGAIDKTIWRKSEKALATKLEGFGFTQREISANKI
jgi:hypothetical protein